MKIEEVKMLNIRSGRIHYADDLGSNNRHDEVVNIYRIQCSLQRVPIPEFLGHWQIKSDSEVNCNRCLRIKRKREKRKK
jgi:hypothetical protein